MMHRPNFENAASAVSPTALACEARWLDWPTARDMIVERGAALAERVSEPNALLEPYALAAALDAFGSDGIRLFTMWQGDRLVGLLPVHADRRYGRWPFPHVRNWLHANAFLGTPLVASGHEHDFWRALLSALDREPGRALFFHIEALGLGGPVEAALIDVAREQARAIGLVHREERAYIGKLDDPTAYFEEAVRGKKRKELRRQKRRLEEEGGLSFERLEGAEAQAILPQWADEFLALEKAGWKGENGSALACASNTERFFREALSGAAQAGRLELVALRFDGRAIAMLVNLLAEPGAFSFKTAYDEGFARYSPGVLLQEYNLGLVTRPGIDWCDSCAAEDHPMIDHLWRERRAVGRYSVGIGGSLRRRLFGVLLAAETKRVAARREEKTND